MPTPTKRPSKLTTKPPAKRRVKAAVPPAQPFLRFYHSQSLREKTLTVLATLEKAKDATEYRNDLAEIVVELTDAGMDYFYLRPLKLADAGFFVQQSANLGMATTTRVLASVIRNIIGHMDSPQLLTICRYIRQLME